MAFLKNRFKTGEDIIKTILFVLCVIYSIFLVITYIKASSYTIPVTDDFSAMSRISGVCSPLEVQIDNAVQSAIKAYKNWQGTYFTYFAGQLLNPLNNLGSRQMRYTMTAFSGFFFVSLIAFILCVTKKNLEKQYLIKAVIVCAVLHALCAYEAYSEIFSWFAGSITYCVPLALAIVGLIMCVISDGFAKWVPFVIAMIIGPIAMGGVLIDVAIACYGCLVLSAFYSWTRKKISIRTVIVFVEWVVFALINALAPGNFNRHSRFDEGGLKPFEALHNTMLITEQRWQFLLGKGFAAILLLMLICGLLARTKRENSKNMLAFSAFGLLTPFVAGFPLALGYSDSRVPNRCAFSIDVSIVLTSTLFAFCLGSYLSRQFTTDSVKVLVCNAGIIAIVCLMLNGYGYSGIKAVEINEQLKRGEYQERYRTCKYLLEKLASYDKDSDVAVSQNEVPTNIDNVIAFYLEPSPEGRWNIEMAGYFELNSISIVD